MKILLLSALVLFALNTQAQSAKNNGPTYVVHLGTYKTPHLFEKTELPYQLMVNKTQSGKFEYFFGKFKTEEAAVFARNLIFLNGYHNPKVKKYEPSIGEVTSTVTRYMSI